MKEIRLSILLPEYNANCVQLVGQLHTMCSKVEGLAFEIIVLDDASKNKEIVEANEAINSIEGCTFLRAEANRGSGAVRNALARRARHEWLLFMDSDVAIPSSFFIRNYVEVLRQCDVPCVVNGGIVIDGTIGAVKGNLRYMYEKAEEEKHTAENRRQAPYQAFRSTNFVAHKSIMAAYPFDERLRRYEDVLIGKVYCEHGIEVKHIGNPVMMGNFEHNAEFIAKVERNLQVLREYRAELEGYSPILTLAHRLRMLLPAVRLWHKLFGARERANLTGYKPSLTILRMYQFGYYVTLKDKR